MNSILLKSLHLNDKKQTKQNKTEQVDAKGILKWCFPNLAHLVAEVDGLTFLSTRHKWYIQPLRPCQVY